MNSEEKTFEEAVSELEQLINAVESGSLPLEKMIDRIAEGAKLIRLCQKKLNTMNGKIEMLFKDDGSTGSFQDFESATHRSRAGASQPAAAPEASAAPAAGTQDDLPF